jgi:hypothetical protein
MCLDLGLDLDCLVEKCLAFILVLVLDAGAGFGFGFGFGFDFRFGFSFGFGFGARYGTGPGPADPPILIVGVLRVFQPSLEDTLVGIGPPWAKRYEHLLQ